MRIASRRREALSSRARPSSRWVRRLSSSLSRTLGLTALSAVRRASFLVHGGGELLLGPATRSSWRGTILPSATSNCLASTSRWAWTNLLALTRGTLSSWSLRVSRTPGRPGRCRWRRAGSAGPAAAASGRAGGARCHGFADEQEFEQHGARLQRLVLDQRHRGVAHRAGQHQVHAALNHRMFPVRNCMSSRASAWARS